MSRARAGCRKTRARAILLRGKVRRLGFRRERVFNKNTRPKIGKGRSWPISPAGFPLSVTAYTIARTRSRIYLRIRDDDRRRRRERETRFIRRFLFACSFSSGLVAFSCGSSHTHQHSCARALTHACRPICEIVRNRESMRKRARVCVQILMNNNTQEARSEEVSNLDGSLASDPARLGSLPSAE